MGFNLSDIAALAKAGYSVADVKELISLSNERQQEAPAQEPEAHEEASEVVNSNNEASQPEDDAKPEAEAVDYKKLYEESQASLKKAQEANTQKDISGSQSKSDEQTFTDFVKSFV